MLRYELKKVFSRTSNKVAMLLLAALVFITCYFALGVSWVDENGDSHSGPAAVARLRAAQKEWAGYLDEEAIRRVILENQRIQSMPEAHNDNVRDSNITYGRGQGIQEIRRVLNCSFAEGFRNYDYYRMDSLTPEDASQFYTNLLRFIWKGQSCQSKAAGGILPGDGGIPDGLFGVQRHRSGLSGHGRLEYARPDHPERLEMFLPYYIVAKISADCPGGIYRLPVYLLSVYAGVCQDQIGGFGGDAALCADFSTLVSVQYRERYRAEDHRFAAGSAAADRHGTEHVQSLLHRWAYSGSCAHTADGLYSADGMPMADHL